MELVRKIKTWWNRNNLDIGVLTMMMGLGLVLITYFLDENMITGIMSIFFLTIGMVIVISSE